MMEITGDAFFFLFLKMPGLDTGQIYLKPVLQNRVLYCTPPKTESRKTIFKRCTYSTTGASKSHNVLVVQLAPGGKRVGT
jgi:hypothetical protein